MKITNLLLGLGLAFFAIACNDESKMPSETLLTSSKEIDKTPVSNGETTNDALEKKEKENFSEQELSANRMKEKNSNDFENYGKIK